MKREMPIPTASSITISAGSWLFISMDTFLADMTPKVKKKIIIISCSEKDKGRKNQIKRMQRLPKLPGANGILPK